MNILSSVFPSYVPMMRLIASMLLTLLFASHAFADAVRTPSPEALQSARAISEVFTDQALVAEITDNTIERRQDEFRAPLLTGPFYENLRPDTQRSLRAFVDRAPQVIREEVQTTMALMREDLTQRLITRFSDAELAALGPMFAHPRFRSSLLDYARSAIREEPSPQAPLDAELEALFTSAAANGAPHHWDVLRVVGESSQAAQIQTRPRTEQRFLREICAAMADECPPHVRRLITPAPAD